MQCVNVCPTGIDIRNGTQLECINCTACIDECDHIMESINLPKGLAVLWTLIRDEKAEGKLRKVKKMDEVLGFGLTEKESVKIPAEIKKMIDEREKARKEKNYEEADKIREEINSLIFRTY